MVLKVSWWWIPWDRTRKKIHGKNKQQFLGIMYSKKISHPFRTKSARKSFSSFLVLHEIFAKFQIDFIFLPMQNDWKRRTFHIPWRYPIPTTCDMNFHQLETSGKNTWICLLEKETNILPNGSGSWWFTIVESVKKNHRKNNSKKTTSRWLKTSGQILIFHYPGFSWIQGISLTKPPSGGNWLCEVAIIWPFPRDEGPPPVMEGRADGSKWL